FLMGHGFGGKVTASEKLRHVAAFFRKYHESLGDYATCMEELNRLLEPARRQIVKLENELGTHLEVVDEALHLSPQGPAYMISRQDEAGARRALPYLLETEERLLQIELRLIEQLLRLGLTRQAPAYNPRLLDGKLDTIVELVGLLYNFK